jgi:predicted transcriptional regulator
MPEYVGTTIYIPKELDEKLRKIASEKRVPMTEIVRQALPSALEKLEVEKKEEKRVTDLSSALEEKTESPLASLIVEKKKRRRISEEEIRQLGEKALELRRKGWTYEEIAKELGYSTTTVWRAVNSLLKEMEKHVEKKATPFFCPVLENPCLQEACGLYDPFDKECSVLGINRTLKALLELVDKYAYKGFAP